MANQFDFVRGMMSLMKSAVSAAATGAPVTFPKVTDLDWLDIPTPYTHVISETDMVPDYFGRHHDSLTISHEPDGRIRRENMLSGVIHEQRADGSITVSLPDGKILRQAFEGAPVLVMDLEQDNGPWLGRMVEARVHNDAPSTVYHYSVPEGGDYIVEMDTLRHFEVMNPAFFGGR